MSESAIIRVLVEVCLLYKKGTPWFKMDNENSSNVNTSILPQKKKCGKKCLHDKNFLDKNSKKSYYLIIDITKGDYMYKKMVSEKERMMIAQFGKVSNLHKIRIAAGHVICFFSSFGLPASHVSVILSMMFNPNAVEPAQLAERVLISRQAMTTILDKLERLGYVERINHPNDRRKKQLRLTAEGVVFGKRVYEELVDFEKETMSALTKEELAIFDRLSEKVLKSLSSKGKDGLSCLEDL